MNHQEELRKEWLKLHYEPEHEAGQTCWCNPKTLVKNGVPHIEHNEQRVILFDFFLSRCTNNRVIEEAIEALMVSGRPYATGDKGLEEFGADMVLVKLANRLGLNEAPANLAATHLN